MNFFQKLFKKKEKSEPEKITFLRIFSDVYSKQMPESLAQVICKNGYVYYNSSPNAAIGSFKREENGDYTVYSEGGVEIGKVNAESRIIYFSLLGKYEYFKKYFSENNFDPLLEKLKLPPDFFWCAAEFVETSSGGFIREYGGDVIGKFSGNGLEAAAAFICWANDLADYSKYGDFFGRRLY